MHTDVVVAGAGPVGLVLAAELRLAGVSVTVLERLTEPSSAAKAGGINGRSTQALVRRGLGDRLDAESARHGQEFGAFLRQRPGPGRDGGPRNRYAGHFAGLLLPVRPESDVPPGVVIPQQALERLLGAWVEELGGRVLRGHEITDFTQDADGVTVRAVTDEGEVAVRGDYLVGCDGGRSTVRKLAGFDFPGTDPIITGHQAVVTLDTPEPLPLGWNATDTGVYAHHTDPDRFIMVEFDGPPADREAEVTLAEVQDSLRRLTGVDVTVTSVRTAGRFTDHTRQAAGYRKGRVLLAGDAAHVHPPFGGQGLNLGLQDAVNLGWKLAATVQGWARDGLLDSYTDERHPVGARVLENTRAQTAVMRPDPHSRAMRELLADLVQDPETAERIVSRTQGLDIRYDLGQATHPLIGRHVPDLPGVEEAMRLPRPVLFDLADSGKLRAAADGWTDRVDVRVLPADGTGLAALLVRPDGYVAWAADGETDATDLDALRHALGRWCGEPRR